MAHFNAYQSHTTKKTNYCRINLEREIHIVIVIVFSFCGNDYVKVVHSCAGPSALEERQREFKAASISNKLESIDQVFFLVLCGANENSGNRKLPTIASN